MTDDEYNKIRGHWQYLYNDGDQFNHLLAKDVLSLCDEIDRLRKLITTAYYTDDEERLELLGEEVFR